MSQNVNSDELVAKRLDQEMRLAGDLEAVLRFVATELDNPMTPLARVQLRAYVLAELKRLRGN